MHAAALFFSPPSGEAHADMVDSISHLGRRRNAFIIQSGMKTNCSGERASSTLHATADS